MQPSGRRTNTKIDAQEIVKGCASGVLKGVLKKPWLEMDPSGIQKTKKAAQGRYFGGFQALSGP
ncbi:hypothetical protein [Pseudomonas fildesensis]|uniref:Uncharacterized protein n=1 Tax=Pseudomonas fildesensis TaxID=1674920 RepID=A0A0J8FW75_9PSED|nr:hypothetical protein [Pseudomonas fildesensis]KMT52984.1 hypothetical protein ACR52_24145 [Pseudomonas fildesensis]